MGTKARGAWNKLTLEQVKQRVESFGYKMVSDTYLGSDSKITVACKNGHKKSVSLDNLTQRRKCFDCEGASAKKGSLGPPFNDKKIIDFVESFGHKAISAFMNPNSCWRVTVECRQGHQRTVDFANFRKTRHCPLCGIRKLENVRQVIEKEEGYKVLSKRYCPSEEKIKIMCPKGHEYTTTLDRFKRGNRCKKCRGLQKFTIEEIKAYVESREGFSLLSSEYEASGKKLKMKCPKGHTFLLSWDNFKQGVGCSYCHNLKKEPECRMVFESIFNEPFPSSYPDFLRISKKNRLQLDGVNHKWKICFEYNGVQHYEKTTFFKNSSLQKQQERDTTKSVLCRKNGYYLIVVPYFVKDLRNFINEEVLLWKATLSGCNE
jgi:hypothetical protein